MNSSGNAGGQTSRRCTQHLVTGLMPDPSDDLEPVEVDEQDRHRIAVQLAALQVLVETPTRSRRFGRSVNGSCSASRASSLSASLRSVMSVDTPTVARNAPATSYTGVVVMNTWSAVRSLQRIHRSPDHVSPGRRADSSIIWAWLSMGGTTCWTKRPMISSRVHPYIRVAALFQNRIRPLRSVPMMACPAASSRSAWNRIESSAVRRTVTSRWLMTMPPTAGSSR